jgi:DNA ligase-1|tara:strand:- start:459 stop:2231 length:1773 start_codon:yes stop_codon:yes gene_type:complete
MDYIKLVEVYEELEATTKRLEKTFIIRDFLKDIKEDDIEQTILLLQGKVFPNWDDRKIGVASRMVLKAINKATGTHSDKIEKEWAKIGDLGEVAKELTKTKKQHTLFSTKLTVKKVFQNLQKLPLLEGQGAVDKKIGLIAELLTSAKPLEAKYIVRTVLEELRVGTAAGTLRDAIVFSFFLKDSKLNKEKNIIDFEEDKDREKYNEIVKKVQRAYDMSNDFSLVAKYAKKGKLGDISLKIGVPIKCMLGPKEKDAKAALDRVGIPAQAEYKYDGFRIQVHKDNDKVILYTRNLENVTKQFPEVVKYVKEYVKGKSFILDSEAVGFDPKTNKYLPFQNISQRIRRKYDIERMSKDYPVELNVFDIMYYDGKSMLNVAFKDRRKIIEKIIKIEKRKITISQAKIVEKEVELNDMFKESLVAGNEGLMVKKLDAPYKPGARVGHMVKLKETEEPLDLVIVEAEWGEGKRAKWFSSFTLACVDENGNFVTIGKVGTGIKEKDETSTEEESPVTFEQLTELLKPLVISEKGKNVKVKPKIVVEVAYDEIQKSPTYTSGFALRFPRVLRLRHMERKAEDVADVDYIEDYYYGQNKN